MLLPMMGFFMMLFVVGGLGSLVTLADPARAAWFPVMLAMLFAGLSLFGLFALMALLAALGLPNRAVEALFIIGLPLCAAGFAVSGFRLGVRQNQRVGNR